MIKIYCIEDCDGLKYIGSTKRTLNQRLSHHRCCKDCRSRELYLNNCKIYTLEECDEEQRKEREQYWIDHTECVNKYNTVFNEKEYRKEYYKENKDKIIEYRKNNRDKLLKQMNNNYHYKNSWGGDPRFSNNLLKIDLNIFL